MVVHEDGYKYIQYDMVEFEEQLLDLNLDPYETRHYTDSKEHQKILSLLQQEFEKVWFPD